MAQKGIVVDTGASVAGMDLAAFYRNAGLVHSALDSMKASVRAFGAGLSRAARGFSRLADYAKGVVSALMQASNLAQGLESGLMNLYRWGRSGWKEFAHSLDSLATSALYRRNSLAAMAAPLLNALAPAIDYVTDKLVGLFNLIGQLFARLTGSSTYVAAKKTADAWDSVSGRISRATSALKRYISGFDQLNVLTDGSGGGSGSGGSGGGGGGAAGMFEERQIESGLSAFADSLKAAFEASDWLALGTLIGGKVNELVESVDWAALGQKVGYYVNALFSTAYWTLETVNFENIGASAAEFLNNALAEVDFSKVGGTIALLFTSFYETVAGFVEEFDWAQFAEKLADGVNGFVATLDEKLSAIDWAGLALKLTDGVNAFIARTDWEGLGRAFAGRINDLLATLGAAAANFDWKGAGTALAEAVNGLFKNVDWEGLGTWLNDTLLGVLDFGLAFLNGFDAAGFADGIGKALSKVDWDAVSEKLWELFSTALKKLGEFVGTLLFGGSADVKLNLELLRKGWETVAKWLGIDDPLAVLTTLGKSGWTSISSFVGTAVTVLATLLKKDGNQTPAKVIGDFLLVRYGLDKMNEKQTLVKKIGDFLLVRYGIDKMNEKQTLVKKIGDFLLVLYGLDKKDGNQTLASKIGTALGVQYTLSKKDGNQTLASKIGTALGVLYTLKKKDDKQTLASKIGTSLSVDVSLSSKSAEALKSAATKALKGIEVTVDAKATSSGSVKLVPKAQGGAIMAGGREFAFASGGVISGGMAKYLSSVPHYASGTTRAHGTVFVAGEAGPEIMGHINGRTEVLNKSQIAQAIYSAVVAGMGKAVNALGTYLANRMGECANAIVETIGNVGAGGVPGLSGLEFRAPAMATGTVMPYEVAAQVARTGADIQNTLDANNEDLIQTIISAIGSQTAAIVAALQSNQTQESTVGGLTARQVIEQINRQARMFGASPIL